jgi:hypothetical protein
MSRTFVQRFIERSGKSSGWLAPFCLAALLQVAAFVLTYGVRVHAMQLQLPTSATVADRLAAAQMIWQSACIRSLFLPVRLFLGWGIFALCLFWGTGFLAPPRPLRFREILTLEMFAEIIPSLGVLIAAVFAPAQASSALPAGAGLSLLVFAPAASWFLKMLLANANLMQLLYIVVLVAGIAKLSGFTALPASGGLGRGVSVLKSASVVFAVWIFAVTTQISFLQLSMTAIRFVPT